MIEMAAEANFKIDQLLIENEGLMDKTIDGESPRLIQSSVNLGDYFSNQQ